MLRAAPPDFLSADLVGWLPREVVVLTRDEFWALNLAREYRDSYMAYRVASAATHMAFMTSEQVDGLNTTVREALLRAQWRFRRGQHWAWEVVQGLNLSPSWYAAAAQRCVDTEDGTKLALDARLWGMVLDAQRTTWLVSFIETEGSPSVTATSNVPAGRVSSARPGQPFEACGTPLQHPADRTVFRQRSRHQRPSR